MRKLFNLCFFIPTLVLAQPSTYPSRVVSVTPLTYTSLIDVTKPPYNIDNTGATDVTAAIQSAINSITNVGGELFFPAGNYVIDGSINLYPYVTLRGVSSIYSQLGTTFTKTGVGVMFNFLGANGVNAGRNLVTGIFIFSSDKSANRTAFKTLGYPSSTTHFKLENVRIYGFKTGAYLDHTWVTEYITTYAENCGTGLLFTNSANAIQILGGEYAQNTNGIVFELSSVVNTGLGVFIRSTFESNWRAIVANGYAGCIMSECSYFEGNTNNFVATNNLNGAVFKASAMQCNGTNFIFGANVRYASIEDCYLDSLCNYHNDGNSRIINFQRNQINRSTYPAVGVAIDNDYYYPMVFAGKTNIAPTAWQIGGTVGAITNHVFRVVNGVLTDYWSDGTTLWSKAIGP